MRSRRGFVAGAVSSVGALGMMACATPQATASEPGASFNVVYPNHEGARFDMAYYRETHIPMVMRIMNADSVKLIEGVSRGDAPAPIVMIAHFQFASAEALDAALAHPQMSELRADLTNFTDIRPTIMFGR